MDINTKAIAIRNIEKLSEMMLHQETFKNDAWIMVLYQFHSINMFFTCN